MYGGQGDHFAQGQSVKFKGVIVPFDIVGFVGSDQDRFAGAAQDIRDLFVGGSNTLDGVNDQHNHIGFLDGEHRLGADLRHKLAAAFFQRAADAAGVCFGLVDFQAARIDNGKYFAVPFHVACDPIPRGAGHLGYNCLTLPDQTVK